MEKGSTLSELWKRPDWWPSHIQRNAAQTMIVYLDLKDWINLARCVQSLTAPAGYGELLASARAAREADVALFPLSGTHYMEMSGLADPRQRADIAGVMEELSGFRVLLGRQTLMRLEIESALDAAGAPAAGQVAALPLIGYSAGWAFGMRGGLRVRDGNGNDITDQVREEGWYIEAAAQVERQLLAGPSDEEADMLRREYGYRPESSWETAERRAQQERELVQRLDAEPVWRRGRLRDVISARELSLEWIDTLTEATMSRGTSIGAVAGGREEIRGFADALPSNFVAITLKTAYHRNAQTVWQVNDIHDIDALSVAVPYCDAVLTDKAARSALVGAKVDRRFGTFLPRMPAELTDWLNDLRG